MNEELAADLKEQILDMQDKLDEFVEEMQKRISSLREVLSEVEIEKPKAKEYER